MAANKTDKMKKAFAGMFSSEEEKANLVAPQNEVQPEAPKTIPMTYMVDKEINKTIKIIAAKEGRKIKDVVNDAFSNYIAMYTAKNGSVQ